MARDGSGNFNLSDTVDPNTDATAEEVNAIWQDIADGLTESISKDGQTVPTANLPMNSNKHTGVANATARTEYAAMGQVQDSTPLYAGTAGGTATVLTATLTPAITAYVTGQRYIVKAASAATGAATINFNSVGAKTIQRNQAAIAAGDWESGDLLELGYDGTYFQLHAPTRISTDYITSDMILDGTIAAVDIATGAVNGAKIAMGSDAQGDVLYHNGTNYARLGAGTSGYFLMTQGSGANPTYATPHTLGTEAATTSGTAVGFTSIPSGVNKITLMFDSVSTGGTSPLMVQIGDSGGYETSGYAGCTGGGGTGVTTVAHNTGFQLHPWANVASYVYEGAIILHRMDGNKWAVSGSVGETTIPASAAISGIKELSATLDRIQITTVGGSDAFDAGAVNISYSR